MNKKMLVLLTFTVSLILNGLANTKILGGNTTGQVSDAYQTLFTPAGVTFSIWGLIYLLAIGYCIRLFWQRKDKAPSRLALDMAPNFTKVSLLNATWILAWQYRVFWLSVLLIVGMVFYLNKLVGQARGHKFDRIDWTLIKLPFSVYAGWVTVATVANISVLLVSLGWRGGSMSEVTMTSIILIIAALIGLIKSWRRQDWAYLAVFIWAYYGIWLRHQPGQLKSLLVGLISLLVLQTVIMMFRNYQQTKEDQSV